MISIVVGVSARLQDVYSDISRMKLKSAFIAALKDAEPDRLISKLNSGDGLFGQTLDDAAVKFDLAPDEEQIVENFARISGLNYRYLMSHILDGVIRNIVANGDETSMEMRLKSTEDSETDYRVLPLTECCHVEAFEDELGNLMCPYCGAFILNRALGERGCPACGSSDISFDGHCHMCFAYLGPRVYNFRESELDGWDFQF